MSSTFPGKFDLLNVYRGDTFNLDIVYNTATAWDSSGNPTAWSVVNMTGGTLLAQVRDGTAYNANLLTTFTIANYVPASGSFTLHLDPSTLATATWTSAYYDVQFTDSNGNVQTIIYGAFDLTDDVSHP